MIGRLSSCEEQSRVEGPKASVLGQAKPREHASRLDQTDALHQTRQVDDTGWARPSEQDTWARVGSLDEQASNSNLTRLPAAHGLHQLHPATRSGSTQLTRKPNLGHC